MRKILKIWMLLIAVVLGLAFTGQATELPGQQLAEIELSSEALNSQNSAVITATLTDAEGKPFTAANVYFNSGKGTLTTTYGSSPQGYLAITDNNGKVQATLKLAAIESVTVTAISSEKSATINVGSQPSTATVTITPTATSSAPPIPSPAATTVKGTTPGVTAPKETASVAATTAAKAPRTPGFGLEISLLSMFVVLILMRRNNK